MFEDWDLGYAILGKLHIRRLQVAMHNLVTVHKLHASRQRLD